ncbi:leucine--tRNA ligase [Bacteroides pyogenes]|uniref:leucine--tRNA ligase n=1 Tax=Bacteroides pyogenes TaxID=310300 RepID=UPI001BA4F465|nr:leucine--tRNA ligase [Bacteroides pyogenes]MBR8708445.1 Leucine--tRNA ligase [Bacteroides pyogenes]MBR8717085.1 Leucine--tRNA ligase [Bacteroides pyogenes]MBR8746860.1 Leucine--tRNA ligase [Bacteroides pyogenes]MBR8757132.1 Leucine--tRNA ligase [Bacteroides pyogenes]MBR8780358.1 Leucine--tRNA ligase [Bacteroides pyogenes]
MEYNFGEIEKKWQKRWVENKIYRVTEDESKQKFYVLNMFPYPSGAGLHVGHPLGYIASDIYARYKRLQGFNVLNPMGYDAYGLPAEQYAIQTGQHPEVTTKANIERYREQLDKIGFCFDWDREIKTCEPEYYHWTQWAFQRMFGSYYCNDACRALPIEELIHHFEAKGTEGLNVACSEELCFTATEWKAKSEKEQQEILMNYRIAYLGETMVNWCPALGTVLANDEVVDGVSERGGHPVVQRKMRQWCLRVSAYAQRLLDGLDTVDWTESLKETQKNWIGRSEGAEVQFKVKDSDLEFTIFTTRADTMFGVTFMVLAPESELVERLTTPEHKAEVEAYLERTKKRTERERISDRSVSGVFSGSYAINPFTGEAVPVWISDYVLAGYGTGAIMAVPAHDSRDYAFAKHFGLEIRPLVEGCDVSEESFDAKEGIVCNSPRVGNESDACSLNLNGLTVKEAIEATKKYVKEHRLGRVKVNFRLRDAIFSRQRYWGEPFPVYYKDGMPYMIDESSLPLELPEVAKFLPTETGEPPLGHAKKWAWDTVNKRVVENEKIDHLTVFPLELNTMPGFAGSSAYYLRYMDPHNREALIDPKINRYWQNVDLYVGGTEHATGHLIYSRFWNKFLHDIGVSVVEEPFQKLVNQGMIQGRSNFVYRIKDTNTFVSLNLKNEYDVTPIHVDVNIVSGDVLDVEAFKAWRPEYANAEFILENGKYICGWAVEKMSKSMFNVVNPDMIVDKYGADTLRMYEMFLGPVEQSKPWDTNGIDGVHRFIRKFWSLFYSRAGEYLVKDEPATKEELKALHKLIKKVTGDIEQFSYNTSVSAFMICVNELSALKCCKKEILEQLAIVLAPFAPHVCEELWHTLGHDTSVCDAQWPVCNEEYLKEDTVNYTVSFNGKARFNMEFSADATSEAIEKEVLADERSQKWIEGKTPKKVIVVPKKIVNVVV